MIYLLLNKNKINGNRTTSLESINSLPKTPDSGASEEEGNKNKQTFKLLSSKFLFNYFYLDEDNESLFGAWFEEVLTLGDQQIENISSKTQASNYVDLDKSVIDTSNLSIVPETDDPEGVIVIFCSMK